MQQLLINSEESEITILDRLLAAQIGVQKLLQTWSVKQVCSISNTFSQFWCNFQQLSDVKGGFKKKKIGEKLHMYKCRKNCNSDHFVPFKIVLIPHLLTDFLSIHLYKLAEWRKGWIIKGYCQLFRVWFELLSKSSLFQLERSQFSQTMLAIYGLHSIKKLEKIS